MIFLRDMNQIEQFRVSKTILQHTKSSKICYAINGDDYVIKGS